MLILIERGRMCVSRRLAGRTPDSRLRDGEAVVPQVTASVKGAVGFAGRRARWPVPRRVRRPRRSRLKPGRAERSRGNWVIGQPVQSQAEYVFGCVEVVDAFLQFILDVAVEEAGEQPGGVQRAVRGRCRR